MSTIKRYVLAVDGGIEPSSHGPYETDQEQISAASDIDMGQDRDGDSLFWIDFDMTTGHMKCGTFSFFSEGEGQKIG